MRKILLALGIVALFCTPAMAGPNANGAIIVHTNDAYTYKSATACTTTLGMPATCETAITQTNVTNASGYSVVWFLAAFLPTATPNVATVFFGHHYDVAQLGIEAYGPCGAGTQIPDATWPFDDDSGTSWGFTTAQTAILFRFYVFQVYENTPPATAGAYFCSDINFLGGYASFISSGLEVDLITKFGCVKWYEAGYNDCPHEQVAEGACCSPLGVCAVVPSTQCLAPSVYLGDGTNCFGDPCPLPGACCVPDVGTCTFGLATDCLTPNVFLGEGILCGPVNPCPAKGACCVPVTGVCYYVLEADCLTPNVYMPGITCVPDNPCPVEHQGACCEINLGVCVMVYAAQCIAPNVFHPEWTCGVDDQCPPPVPTQPTTWGQIKANYR